MEDIYQVFLDELENNPEDVDLGKYTPSDDVSAEKALCKIAELRRERDRLNHLDQAIIDERYQRILDRNEKCTNQCANLEQCLFAYFSTVHHKVTKTQETYALSSGKLVLKQPPMQYTRDDEALSTWMASSGRGDLIDVKLVPRWGDLKKQGVKVLEDGQCVIEETGEIIDGVTAVTPDPVFQIQVTAKEG